MEAAVEIASGRALGVGRYTVPAAARLIAAHQNKVRSWVNGYPESDAEPIIQRDLPDANGRALLSFLDLVETAFVRHFRMIGYTPQTIRKVANKLRQRYEVQHPFAMDTRFRADGKQIFEETVSEDGERKLLNLMNDNFEMRPVVEGSLFRRIFYVDDVARRWTPVAEIRTVVVDPTIAFGKPVVLPFGIPTATLARDVEIFGSVNEVSEEYDVPTSSVQQALKFEQILSNRLLH